MELPQARTNGYALVDASVGWHRLGERFEHILTLRVENVANQEWRDHLSRIKDVAPQPSRNVLLTYRVNYL